MPNYIFITPNPRNWSEIYMTYWKTVVSFLEPMRMFSAFMKSVKK